MMQSFETFRLDWNVAHFVELKEAGRIDLDTPVQRGYVWNEKKDSLLIRSLLMRIPISNFYFNRVSKDAYEALEGKQRGHAMYGYVKGLYALHASTKPIVVNGEVIPIARRRFDELPQSLQNTILRYPLDAYAFENMDMDQKIEFFILTNSGKPVTPSEISRIRIKSRKTIVSLAEHEAIVAAISLKNRRKLLDEAVIEDIWLLLYTETPNLLSNFRGAVFETAEITQEQTREITEALAYLAELYKDVMSKKALFSKMRKKSHIVSLAYMAAIAIRKGISVERYIEKAKAFFDGEGRTVTVSEEYNVAASAGSAKPEQVAIRMREIEKALYQ